MVDAIETFANIPVSASKSKVPNTEDPSSKSASRVQVREMALADPKETIAAATAGASAESFIAFPLNEIFCPAVLPHCTNCHVTVNECQQKVNTGDTEC